MCLGVLQEQITKRHVFIKDWTTSLNNDNHSKLNSQHKWGDLYAKIMSIRIFTLIMNKIII